MTTTVAMFRQGRPVEAHRIRQWMEAQVIQGFPRITEFQSCCNTDRSAA